MFAPHFSFNELTRTDATDLLAGNRSEASAYLKNLEALSWLAEDVRTLLGVVCNTHSGFRGPTLNRVKKGSKTSQHLVGQGWDFDAEGLNLRACFEKIKANDAIMARVGQLLLEGRGPTPGWIHLSLGPGFWVHPERCGEIGYSLNCNPVDVTHRWTPKGIIAA